jgi:hypothetical protein
MFAAKDFFNSIGQKQTFDDGLKPRRRNAWANHFGRSFAFGAFRLSRGKLQRPGGFDLKPVRRPSFLAQRGRRLTALKNFWRSE